MGNREILKFLLNNFNDLPLTRDKEDFLINRENDLNTLSLWSENYENTIVGISGERGIGKTSILNIFLPPKGSFRLIIKVREKDNTFAILVSILRSIAINTIKTGIFKGISSTAKDTLDFLSYHEERIGMMKYGLSEVLELGGEKGKIKAERFNLVTVRDRLDTLLGEMAKKTKIIICIDEIDKEKSKDVVNILDSVKEVFRKKNLLVIISLPPSIYHAFLRDELIMSENYNLDDIVKNIWFMPSLSQKNILDAINIRLDKYQDSIEPDAKRLLVEYAMGNPRRSILPMQQVLGYKMGEDLPVSKKDIYDAIRAPLEKYIEELNIESLSPTQKQMLEILINKFKRGHKFIKRMLLPTFYITEGLKKSTVYDNIAKLKEILFSKNILIRKDGDIALHPWVKIYY